MLCTKVLLLGLASLVGACVHIDRGLGDLAVSPNGRFAAYWSYSATAVGLVEAKEIGGSVDVKWIDLDHPFLVGSKRVYETNGPLLEFSNRALAFSLNSKYLAALIAGALYIVDPESNKAWRVSSPEEYVSSFCWIANDELAYARIRPDGAFFKRRVQDATSRPIAVVGSALPGVGLLERRREPWEEPVGLSRPREWWAPGGRFVLFVWTDSSIHLLDTQTGAVHKFEHLLHSVAAGWNPDGSVCFVALGDMQFRPERAFMVSGSDGTVRDLTSSFVDTFRDPEPAQLSSRPAIDRDIQGYIDFNRRELSIRLSFSPGDVVDWTADGRFVIISSARLGSCLIRVDPWEVIPIGNRFTTAMKPTERYQREIRRNKEYSAPLLPLSISGWAKSYMGGYEYAINYETNTAVELAAHYITLAPPGAVVTSDGNRVVTLDILGNLKVSSLDLSKAPVVANW